MKHVKIITSNCVFLFINAPKGSYDITMGTHSIGVKIDKDVKKDTNGWHHIYSDGLFYGGLTLKNEGYLVGSINNLSHDSLNEIIKEIGYQIYDNDPKDKLYHLLASNNIVFENRLGENPCESHRNTGDINNRCIDSCQGSCWNHVDFDYDEWEEEETKVWDEKLTYIFKFKLK